jgi:hypothetical protein
VDVYANWPIIGQLKTAVRLSRQWMWIRKVDPKDPYITAFPFIKIFAKYHGIPVSGTKIILLSRRELLFKKHISAIILQ